MSNPQQSNNGQDMQGPYPSNNTPNLPGELPIFQSFPAALNSRVRPDSWSQAHLASPAASQVTPGSIYQSTDDVRIHHPEYRQSEGDSMPGPRPRTVTLPAFTPFPSAAPGSRWAPPEGGRAAPTVPVPVPALAPEPIQHHGFYHGDAVRYPSGLPPGQPSPYAPPGPLTARPHVCEHCNTGFARAHDLRRHMERHRSDRPHKCPNCQRSFSRKDAVHRHLVSNQCPGPSAGSSSR